MGPGEGAVAFVVVWGEAGGGEVLAHLAEHVFFESAAHHETGGVRYAAHEIEKGVGKGGVVVEAAAHGFGQQKPGGHVVHGHGLEPGGLTFGFEAGGGIDA